MSIVARVVVVTVVLLGLLGLGGATCGLEDATTLPPPDLEKTEVLGVGDVVEVRIFGEAELSGTHQISEQGTIRLPLVGAILAAGLSPDELSASIAAAYNAQYLKRAEVSLFVKERNSQKVFVLGQVGKPGPVAIAGRRITVIEAIAQAGGTSKLADASRVVLTREKDGKQIRVAVDVAAIGKGQAPDIEMQPGDILFVPETLF
jgi:protein involved in polysaccharide export with SLBB domain